MTYQLINSDCLDAMRTMDSNTIDLIYLDPPFNTGKVFEGASGASFEDKYVMDDAYHESRAKLPSKVRGVVEFYEDYGKSGTAPYICNIAERLCEMRRVLKQTGSIYLHCDNTAVHYIKIAMDAIFGVANFRNMVVWCYVSPASVSRSYPRKFDTILFYSVSDKNTFNVDHARTQFFQDNFDDEDDGSQYDIGSKSSKGNMIEDWWVDIPQAFKDKDQYVNYPTQKPLKLLDRIIRVSSNHGDLVYDPFNGSGTTGVAAVTAGRNYIGSDISPDAIAVATKRIDAASRQESLL